MDEFVDYIWKAFDEIDKDGYRPIEALKEKGDEYVRGKILNTVCIIMDIKMNS